VGACVIADSSTWGWSVAFGASLLAMSTLPRKIQEIGRTLVLAIGSIALTGMLSLLIVSTL
jgi:hypothetical protein